MKKFLERTVAMTKLVPAKDLPPEMREGADLPAEVPEEILSMPVPVPRREIDPSRKGLAIVSCMCPPGMAEGEKMTDVTFWQLTEQLRFLGLPQCDRLLAAGVTMQPYAGNTELRERARAAGRWLAA
jgi:hypothetical protein